MNRTFITIVTAIALLAGVGGGHADAQADRATITGIARADDGAPIPFAIVRLLPVGRNTPVTPPVLSEADGRFRFDGLSAGEYRLQVERIGFQRSLSPVLQLAAGQSLEYDIRSSEAPIQLATTRVYPAGTCFTIAQLTGAPDLAAVWTEARKGVEVRLAFERQYRFVRVLSQDRTLYVRMMRDHRLRSTDTTVNEPDSVAARDEASRADRRKRGYATGLRLSLPDDKELLDDGFLSAHCLETPIEQKPGGLGLRFRPVGTHAGTDVRGVIWLDSRTSLVTRLEFEYVDSTRTIAETNVTYEDVVVDGSPIRLPSAGSAALHRPGGALFPGLVTGGTATFKFAYSAFQRVPVK